MGHHKHKLEGFTISGAYEGKEKGSKIIRLVLIRGARVYEFDITSRESKELLLDAFNAEDIPSILGKRAKFVVKHI